MKLTQVDFNPFEQTSQTSDITPKLTPVNFNPFEQTSQVNPEDVTQSLAFVMKNAAQDKRISPEDPIGLRKTFTDEIPGPVVVGQQKEMLREQTQAFDKEDPWYSQLGYAIGSMNNRNARAIAGNVMASSGDALQMWRNIRALQTDPDIRAMWQKYRQTGDEIDNPFARNTDPGTDAAAFPFSRQDKHVGFDPDTANAYDVYYKTHTPEQVAKKIAENERSIRINQTTAQQLAKQVQKDKPYSHPDSFNENLGEIAQSVTQMAAPVLMSALTRRPITSAVVGSSAYVPDIYGSAYAEMYDRIMNEEVYKNVPPERLQAIAHEKASESALTNVLTETGTNLLSFGYLKHNTPFFKKLLAESQIEGFGEGLGGAITYLADMGLVHDNMTLNDVLQDPKLRQELFTAMRKGYVGGVAIGGAMTAVHEPIGRLQERNQKEAEFFNALDDATRLPNPDEQARRAFNPDYAQYQLTPVQGNPFEQTAQPDAVPPSPIEDITPEQAWQQYHALEERDRAIADLVGQAGNRLSDAKLEEMINRTAAETEGLTDEHFQTQLQQNIQAAINPGARKPRQAVVQDRQTRPQQSEPETAQPIQPVAPEYTPPTTKADSIAAGIDETTPAQSTTPPPEARQQTADVGGQFQTFKDPIEAQVKREQAEPVTDLQKQNTGWLYLPVTDAGAPTQKVAILHPQKPEYKVFDNAAHAYAFAIDNPIEQPKIGDSTAELVVKPIAVKSTQAAGATQKPTRMTKQEEQHLFGRPEKQPSTTPVQKLQKKIEQLEQRRTERVKKGRTRGAGAGGFNRDVDNISHQIKLARDDLKVEQLIEQYNATGRVAKRSKSKNQISVDGRAMSEEKALEKINSVLNKQEQPKQQTTEQPELNFGNIRSQVFNALVNSESKGPFTAEEVAKMLPGRNTPEKIDAVTRALENLRSEKPHAGMIAGVYKWPDGRYEKTTRGSEVEKAWVKENVKFEPNAVEVDSVDGKPTKVMTREDWNHEFVTEDNEIKRYMPATTIEPLEKYDELLEQYNNRTKADKSYDDLSPVKKNNVLKAARKEYFTPGNIVKSYSGHDRVIKYDPGTDGKHWEVFVEEVKLQDGEWVTAGRKRSHMTEPETRNNPEFTKLLQKHTNAAATKQTKKTPAKPVKHAVEPVNENESDVLTPDESRRAAEKREQSEKDQQYMDEVNHLTELIRKKTDAKYVTDLMVQTKSLSAEETFKKFKEVYDSLGKSQAAEPKATEEARAAVKKPQYIHYTVGEHRELMHLLDAGKVTPEELKSAFNRAAEHKEALTAELNKQKVDSLVKWAGMFARKSDGKARLVDQVYRGILQDFNILPGGLTYQLGGANSFENALRAKVESITEEDIKNYAERRQAAKKAREERITELKASIENPQTLEDFQRFIEYKGKDKLTTEQRRRYEDLAADKTKEKLSAEQDKKATLRRVQLGNVEMTMVKTKHTQKGHDLWVVRLSEKVDKDVYNELNGKAKALGGYYSSYKGNGAVPGFTFTEEEKAQRFMALKESDVDRSDILQERKEEKEQNAVERIRETASSMEESATEQLNADRKTNTHRRAAQAASAEAAARGNLQLSRTLNRIADAVEAKDVKFLDGIRYAIDVAMLEKLLHSAVHTTVLQESKQNDSGYGYYEKNIGRTPTETDIDNANYPYPWFYKSDLLHFARHIEDKPGLKLAAQRMEKLASTMKDDGYVEIKNPDFIDKSIRQVAQKGRYLKIDKGVVDRAKYLLEKYDRLQRMGIPNEATLRAALREYIKYRGDKVQSDKAKELERKLVGQKIPGFFPTPPAAVSELIELANIAPGMRVLEPSAGTGNIAEAARDAGADVEVIEWSSQLAEVLEAKGYKVIGRDFLDFHTGDLPASQQFDRIVMNPPWGKEVSTSAEEHVRHAYSILKPGGRLVAIMPESTFFKGDKETKAFRDWLDDNSAEYERQLDPGTFMDPTQLRTTAVSTRIVVIDKPLDVTNEMPSRALYSIEPQSNEQYKEVAEAYLAISESPEMFQYPKSDALELADIAKAVDPSYRVRPWATKDESKRDIDGRVISQNWVIEVPVYTKDKTISHYQKAYVTERTDGTLYLNIYEFKEGGGGSSIYSIVANYAYNNGLVFIGDTAGISEAGARRRVTNMLSSALKFGTTRHIRPHPWQVKGWYQNIPAVPWHEGDDLFNIRSMINAEREIVTSAVPEAADMVYDVSTDTYRNANNGRPVDQADIRKLLASPGARAAQVGSTTLKRTAIANTFLRGSSETVRRRILGAIVRSASQHVRPTGLQKLAHSKNEPAKGGFSVSEVEKIIANEQLTWGRGAPDVKVVESLLAVPENVRKDAPENVEAIYAEDGTIYMIASNLKSERVLPVLAHEVVGHYSMERMLGDDFHNVLNQVQLLKRSGDKTVDDIAKEVANRYGALDADTQSREIIAVMAERGIKHPIITRIVAAIKQFLRKLGFRIKFSAIELEAMIVKAARQLRTGQLSNSASGQDSGAMFSTAYHGSPSRFDSFKTKHIGSGEGAQSFGWGLYFADKRDIAEWYRNKLSDEEITINGQLSSKFIEESGLASNKVTFLSEAIKTIVSQSIDGYISFKDSKSGVLSDLKFREVNAEKYGDDITEIQKSITAIRNLQEGDIKMKKTGGLYEVELAPEDHEYLQWDKPLNQQSETVRNAISNLPGDLFDWLTELHEENGETSFERDSDAYTGKDLYRGMVAYAKEGGLAEYGFSNSESTKQEVSLVLNELGIRGIKYLDGGSRRSGTGSYNYVIFREDDVKINAVYSRPPQETLNNIDAEAAKQPTWKESKDKIKSRFLEDTRGGDYGWLGLLTRLHLADIGRDVLPQVDAYVKRAQQMDADRNHLLVEAAHVVQPWAAFQSKNTDAADAMAALMHDATISGVDPAEPYKPIITEEEARKEIRTLQEHARMAPGEAFKYIQKIDDVRKRLGFEKKRAAAAPDLQRRWASLPSEAKTIYRQVRDLYRSRFEEVQKTLIERIQRTSLSQHEKTRMTNELRLMFESAAVEGPYFPLARFGDYWVSVEKPGDWKKKYRITHKADKYTVTQYGKRKAEAEFDTKQEAESYAAQNTVDREFYMFDRAHKSRTFAKEQQMQGYKTVRGKKLENLKDVQGASEGFVSEIMSMFEGVQGAQADLIKDSIWQLYLTTLPDMSIRKHFIHRQKTKGYSNDALRAMAHQTFHGSYQLARLRHSDVLQVQLENMRENLSKTDDPEKATDIYNELTKRHQWAMNPNSAPWANKLTSLSFVWYLGITPAAAMVNTTQTAFVTLPVLGAEYGWGKSSAALTKASKDFFAGFNGSLKDGFFSVEKSLSGDELRMIKELADAGVIDKTLAHDLAGMSETPSTIYSDTNAKVMGGISYLFHHAERFNREVTALATYRLAKQTGMSHENAVDEARRVVYESHFDYSNSNKARFMQSDAAKVIFIFKQYSLNMTYLLARNLRQSMKGESPEVRSLARKKLAGVIGMHALGAGLYGLPLFWMVEAVLNAVFDDEDEPWDFKTEFRNFLADHLGDKAAEAITKGAANASGVDLHSRVSINELWFRSGDKDLEGKDLAQQWINNIAGPLGGIVMSVGTGFDLIHDGHVQRGIEAMTPKAVKDGLKMVRYANEGVQSLRGDSVVDELNPFELFLQGVGFTPGEVAKQYDVNRAIKKYQSRLHERRQYLINRWWLAHHTGDIDAEQEARENIAWFNNANPTQKIDAGTLRGSARTREQRSAKSENGVYLPRKEQHLRDRVRFGDE